MNGKQFNDLIRQARDAGLRVNQRGEKWYIGSPHGDEPPVWVYPNGHKNSGAEAKLRSRIMRLIRNAEQSRTPPPQPFSVPGGALETDERPGAREKDAAPVTGVAADARAVWEFMREGAAEQGDRAGSNAGDSGVLWDGALSRLYRTVCPDWDNAHQQDVSRYLAQSRNAHCQSKYARPPIWWVRTEWNDGDLIVTKKAPAPQTPATTGQRRAGAALEFLHDAERRIRDAEERASTAERTAADLAQRLEEATGELEQLKEELDMINAGFARLTHSR